MGVDFIGRIGRGYTKHLDKARVRLATADLFCRNPEEATPTYPVRLCYGANVTKGQQLTVWPSGNSLIYLDVLSVVARDDNPDSEAYEAVINSSSIALATVHEVHRISMVAEVSLC